jgi:LacI family transcriptional regulator
MGTRKKVILHIDPSDYCGRHLLRGVSLFLREQPLWNITLVQEGPLPEQYFSSAPPDGVISRFPMGAEMQTLIHQGVHVIGVDYFPENSKFPFLGTNQHAVGIMAANHLTEKGLVNFGFFGYAETDWSKTRLHGFRLFHEQFGRNVGVLEVPWRNPKESTTADNQESISRWIHELPKPVGIMAANDCLALQLIQACSNMGTLVPGKVAVVGVDNEEHLCMLSSPTLSSICQDMVKIGYEAAMVLEQLMDGKKHDRTRHLYPPSHVVMRESTDLLIIKDPLLDEIVQYICQNALTGCRVMDVAEKFGVSRAILETRFRKELKKSPNDFIREYQVKHVKKLLTETDLKLDRIAHLTGFTHPEYMSVLFKRIVGITPGAYREANTLT